LFLIARRLTISWVANFGAFWHVFALSLRKTELSPAVQNRETRVAISRQSPVFAYDSRIAKREK
jgi:hypothetical protein